MNWMQRWYRFARADRQGRTPRQRREDAARARRPRREAARADPTAPVPGAGAPPSATTAGSGAHRPGRAPAPGSAHAPSRKVIDVRTCGCVYVWDRVSRQWALVACGATPARFAAAVEQWLKDGAL